MGWWSNQVVPRVIDYSLKGVAVGEERANVCRGLTGRVLEVGFGSGLNVRWYPGDVTSVSAVEPSDVAWRLSERRRERTSIPIARHGLDGQRLAEADVAYDAVLCTFTLCTIPDAGVALAEMRRVLRPGGRLHLLEHGLSNDPAVVGWQRRLEPVQRRVCGGCHLTRDPLGLARDAGFTVEDSVVGPMPGFPDRSPLTFRFRARLSAP
ncbi:MAG TPA: class I SAM-dependent methyltransferase [Tetrasphaera sp.]|uniref:class I SAM-dependent methyltransferase n=1 Tax=Nostocoides sp. TaxID=1917966 RepID=UPI002B98BB5C|nr:class I SAM-dependent methyltransferase [Tetrasphaera sp.]HNQ08244.1 class I SAM-dependent methyltransferase [Tetrasphaera sp.]